jgi:hypothetical protein
MSEDFGWSGDEFLLGDCQEDWLMDMLDLRAEEYAERQRQHELEETLLEFADEANDEYGHERDLCDIVREQDEREDWVGECEGDELVINEDEDDYDCDE